MTSERMATKYLRGAVLAALAGLGAWSLAARGAEPPPPPRAPTVHPVEHSPEPGRVEAGRHSFRTYCASCHGEAARGDGPVARDLKVAPSDLTSLAKTNGGTFPYGRVYQAIDGSAPVRGHGTSEMPVWGLTFQDRGRDANQVEAVREQIRDLLAYLQSIQAT